VLRMLSSDWDWLGNARCCTSFHILATVGVYSFSGVSPAVGGDPVMAQHPIR
jgi:hypothetical protein